jgi:hypothetical protein
MLREDRYMALTVSSRDEITSGMADSYDSLLEQATGRPVKIWRNNNNKLYLVFQAIGEGIRLLLDSVMALRNRFNPALCDEADLYFIAKIVGTQIKKGAGSILHITVVNENTAEQKELPAGRYQYLSVSGEVFTFTLSAGLLFGPGDEKIVFAVSGEIGAYHVTDNKDIAIARYDGEPVDTALSFSCADNSGSLGYPDEDPLAFRQRVLNDTSRQDYIKETELKIRNLPGILECNLVFNQNNHESVYDGLTLAPMELLIVITGAPTDEIAEIVASGVVYQTHQVNAEHVVYYSSDCYIGGRYPVYYTFHAHTDFSLEITYRYDPQQQHVSQIESAFSAALKKFMPLTEFTDIINEETFYATLSALGLAGVKILGIDILADGGPVPYLEIPRTRLPNLSAISFTAIETGAEL